MLAQAAVSGIWERSLSLLRSAGLSSCTIAGSVAHTPKAGLTLGTSTIAAPIAVPATAKGIGLASWKFVFELPWVTAADGGGWRPGV